MVISIKEKLNVELPTKLVELYDDSRIVIASSLEEFIKGWATGEISV
jgi:hypothetical protein